MTFFSPDFLAQVLRITLPYLFAAMGGVLCERAGIINLGLEGVLLISAFGASIGAYYGHGPFAGAALGLALGTLLMLWHGWMSIRFKANQIISGIALNLLAMGFTEFLLKMFFDSSSNSPRVEHVATSWLPSSSSVFVRDVLANPFFHLAWLSVAGLRMLFLRTRFGLRLRAVGDAPEAARSLGVPTARVRYMAVILSGLFASLGGIVLAFDQHQFTNGMSGGRGFIAVAAVIFGRWSPLGAAFACLLFGAAEAVQIQLQSQAALPGQFVQMIPYIVTLVALCGVVNRSRAPLALGRILDEE